MTDSRQGGGDLMGDIERDEFDWRGWMLAQVGTASTVNSARKTIERVMAEVVEREQKLEGAVGTMRRARDLLDCTEGSTRDDKHVQNARALLDNAIGGRSADAWSWGGNPPGDISQCEKHWNAQTGEFCPICLAEDRDAQGADADRLRRAISDYLDGVIDEKGLRLHA